MASIQISGLRHIGSQTHPRQYLLIIVCSFHRTLNMHKLFYAVSTNYDIMVSYSTYASSVPCLMFHSFTASSQVRHIFVLAPQALHLHICLFGNQNGSSTIVPHPQNGHGLGCSLIVCSFPLRTPSVITEASLEYVCSILPAHSKSMRLGIIIPTNQRSEEVSDAFAEIYQIVFKFINHRLLLSMAQVMASMQASSTLYKARPYFVFRSCLILHSARTEFLQTSHHLHQR